VKWYGLAAEQGDADAQVNLGVMYSAARGTSQNYVLAHKWFSLAAERYPASDRQKRQQAMRNTELLESKMTPEQLAEARRLARTWQPKTS
jgi:TPR repeat protein